MSTGSSANRRLAPEPVSRLIADQLAAAADEKTRRWWERYLKGAVPFRGVPMATTRQAVCSVWRAEGIDRLDPAVQIDLALAQFAEAYCEDKLAGVLALGELLLAHLTIDDVPALARPFELGHIADWNTCDWYCVKVLGRFVEAGEDRRHRAEAIAAWRDAPTLWQRRAAAVSFVNLAPHGDEFFPGFTDLLVAVAARNVADRERFSQTSVGWLLRELSRAEPERVRRFVDDHQQLMSREALKGGDGTAFGAPLAAPGTVAQHPRADCEGRASSGLCLAGGYIDDRGSRPSRHRLSSPARRPSALHPSA